MSIFYNRFHCLNINFSVIGILTSWILGPENGNTGPEKGPKFDGHQVVGTLNVHYMDRVSIFCRMQKFPSEL